MATHAKGTFDVNIVPLADDHAGAAGLGRMSIDKQFHGDLEASSRGQMMSVMTQVKGSAGYVAMEQVTGVLMGRTGSFVLQHSATMDRGTPSSNIHVVPDSGTDELTGLSGSLSIIIADGKHSYDFAYLISDSQ